MEIGMEKILPYIKSRLRERSTWLGLVLLLSWVGVDLDQGQAENLVLIGGLLAALIPDRPDA